MTPTKTSPKKPRTAPAKSAPGPLMVSKSNPRYFTVATAPEQQAIYLTGSHIWNNFHDGMGPGAACVEPPEPFDFDGYLQFLKERGHNFIRLWRWEQFQSQAAGGDYHLCMRPQPWRRTGPGAAKDGQPKFDLDTFEPAYFDRLRQRVSAAEAAGIYVAVMLFDGWALHLSPAPDNVEGHPFYATNNINGVHLTSIRDHQVLPLTARVQEIEAAFIRKVVDTVQDLPNVLWEVSNESCGGGTVDQSFAEMMGYKDPPDWGDSTDWQYWVIDVVKRHERERGYPPHPIGMTMQFPVAKQTEVNTPLFKSAAEWISPGYDDEIYADGLVPMAPDAPQSHWLENPPPAEGRKVIITDTDHYAPGHGDALWAWKSFLRGHHPILMDFGLITGVTPPEGEAAQAYAAFEPARYAMGDTRRYAERMDLIRMEPRGDVSSTGYALAQPGHEYLLLQPADQGEAFTVKLAAGDYAVEWFNVNARTTVAGDRRTVSGPAAASFSAPFTGSPAVLYLKRASG